MSDLYDFLKKKKNEKQEEEVNWTELKKEWLLNVDHFMKEVKGWLFQAEQDGLVEIRELTVSLSEEQMGEYSSIGLEIISGTESVKVLPVARLVIAARGRIDIFSMIGRYVVLDLPSKGWHYTTESRDVGYYPFNEESFTKMLKDLLG